MKNAGVDPQSRTSYSFRYTFNTYALKLLPMETVQHLMGCKTEDVTRLYNHPTEDDLLTSVQDVRGILGGMF